MIFKINLFFIFQFCFLNQIYANVCEIDKIEPYFAEDLQYIKNPSELKTLSLSLNPQIQLAAVRQIRNLLFNQTLYDEFIDSRIIQVLVRHLKSKNTVVIYEATWALTNLASGTSEQTQSVVEADSIPALMDLLEFSNVEIVTQAVWALANIIGDNPKNRDICIKLGIIPKLLKLINDNTSTKLLQNIAWSMVNLCRKNDPWISIQNIQELLTGFEKLLNHYDATVISDTLWGIASIADTKGKKDENDINLILDHEIIVKKVIELLTHPKDSIKLPALQVIGNIVSGTHDQTQKILDYGILINIKKLFEITKNKKVIKVIIWILSNILAGPVEQVNEVFDADLVPSILAYSNVNNIKIKNEVIWCIRNVLRYDEPTEVMMKMGVALNLCEMLKDTPGLNDVDADNVLINILTALKEIASSCNERKQEIVREIHKSDTASVIAKLQKHKNAKIRELASKYKLKCIKK